MQADLVAGRHASTNAVVNANLFKVKSGTNTAQSQIDVNAYIGPMPKKQKKNS